MFLTLCNNTSRPVALKCYNKFSSLKNTQNYFNSSSKAGAHKWNSPTLTTLINFGQFRHYVHGFDLAWIVPLRTIKKFCKKLSIIIVGNING